MKINNLKIWIKIKKSEFKNINHLLKELRENNFILSPWIENILLTKKIISF